MSLPTIADVLVNCVPVSCMPSPESPANRMVTVSSSSRCLLMGSTGGSKTALITLDDVLLIRISDCPLPVPNQIQILIGNRQSIIGEPLHPPSTVSIIWAGSGGRFIVVFGYDS